MANGTWDENVDWGRIESFVGYGSAAAPVVFIGTEEGLARPDALREDLLCRSGFAPVMDAEVAHRGLADGPALFSEHPRSQPTWRVMADLMLHFEKRVSADPKERAGERTLYRSRQLGRADGDSLLVELLPYPNQREGDWPYGDRFATRAEYVDKLLPKRVELISRELARYSRAAIVCYGRRAWPEFKMLFPPDTRWETAKLGQREFECTTWRDSKVTLAYHFSRWFNTDAELDELAAVALRTFHIGGDA